MKAKLSKNKKFITISPKPTRKISNGLVVYLKRGLDERERGDLPIIKCDVIIGKTRYYLPLYEYDFRVKSIKVVANNAKT